MCINGGLELALNADYIVSTETALFNLLQFPVGFPLIDHGSLSVAKIIGADNAISLIKSGNTFTARQALAMGLINEIVHPNELQPRVYIHVLTLDNYNTIRHTQFQEKWLTKKSS